MASVKNIDASIYQSIEKFTFAGIGSYTVKGCYAYYHGSNKGKVYYGYGGTDADKAKDLDGDTNGKFRPPGFDCAEGQ